jgi:hypothetical protein
MKLSRVVVYQGRMSPGVPNDRRKSWHLIEHAEGYQFFDGIAVPFYLKVRTFFAAHEKSDETLFKIHVHTFAILWKH